MRARLAFVMVLALSSAAFSGARAADLTVIMRDKAGRPIKDAVVMVEAPGVRPAQPRGPYRVVQHHMQFDPFVLVAPVGADVSFPNHDEVRHHVYSFSPAKIFELRLFGREDSPRTVKFDKAGAVAIGCNIHDSMMAFIKIVATPHVAKSDANGRVRLTGLPGGAVTMKVWHPFQRGAGNEISRPLTLGAAEQTVALALDLRAAPDRSGAY